MRCLITYKIEPYINPMPSAVNKALECVEKNIVVNDTRITYFERGIAYRGRGPTLLFVHATGFHARVWDKIINALGNVHSISIDSRGHGRSENKKITHWQEVIDDVHDLILRLDLQNIVGIGHSMGAHALIGASASMQKRFRKIIAIDPVIPSEEAFQADIPSPFTGAEMHPTAKRRNEFDSPEEMADRLRPKGSYGKFDPEMFMDYCRYGLLPNEHGKGYVLACPPVIEASVYMSSRSNHDIYNAVRAIEFPVLILRAMERPEGSSVMDFSTSPTWPGLVGEFKQGREIHFADRTHFLPMEIPEEITRIIAEEISE